MADTKIIVALICTPEEKEYIKSIQGGDFEPKEIYGSEESVLTLTFNTLFKEFNIYVVDCNDFNLRKHGLSFIRKTDEIVISSCSRAINEWVFDNFVTRLSGIGFLFREYNQQLAPFINDKKDYFTRYFQEVIRRWYGNEKNLRFIENKPAIPSEAIVRTAPDNIDCVNETTPIKKYVVGVTGGLVEVTYKFHKHGEFVEI